MKKERGKHARKRNPQEIARDRALISTMTLRGKTQHQIARELNISRDMVQYDLGVLTEEWMKAAAHDIQARKAQQIAELEWTRGTALDAWEKSKLVKKTIQRQTGATGKSHGLESGGQLVAIVENQESPGDPRFLALAMECSKHIREILGITNARVPTQEEIQTSPLQIVGETNVIMLPAFSTPEPPPIDVESTTQHG